MELYVHNDLYLLHTSQGWLQTFHLLGQEDASLSVLVDVDVQNEVYL